LPAEDQQLQARTKQLAVETLGLKLEGSVDAGHRDNFSGLRTENVTFTQRLDSRTFIAYDKRFSDTAKTGIYKDADEVLLKRSRETLQPGCIRVSLDIHSCNLVAEAEPRNAATRLQTRQPRHPLLQPGC